MAQQSVVSISQALADVAEPFLAAEGMSRVEVEGIYRIAAVVWNALLVPDGRHLLEEASPTEDRQLLETMIERRTRLHGDDKRFVTGFEVHEVGGKYQVQVSCEA
jgi:hypothetical protein